MRRTIGIDCNDKNFKLQELRDNQIKYLIWQGMIDYLKIESSCTLNLINKATKETKEEKTRKTEFLVEFDS